MATSEVFAPLWVVPLNLHVRVAKAHNNNTAFVVLDINGKLLWAFGCSERFVKVHFAPLIFGGRKGFFVPILIVLFDACPWVGLGKQIIVLFVVWIAWSSVAQKVKECLYPCNTPSTTGHIGC